MSVNGHTEFFKKGISTGLKSGSVAEGRVKLPGYLCFLSLCWGHHGMLSSFWPQ